MTGSERMKRAYKIASDLEAGDCTGPDVTAILAMALGLFMEGQEDSHRDLEPLTAAMTKGAQIAFDALREGRNRAPGNS